jgi:peptide subunit release factor 1 (eRF1)
MESNVSGTQKKLFQKQLRRITDYLRHSRRGQRGIAVFAGPESWEVLSLQVEVSDELHWGLPSLKQLLWLLDEHRLSGVVVITRAAARFFRFWLGEIDEEQEESFSLDTSGWRRKDLVGPSHPRVGKAKGSQRDPFADRLEAQYRRFHKDIAKRVRRWADKEKMAPVVLAGPAKLAEAILTHFPSDFKERIVLLKRDLWHIPQSELQSQVERIIARWERKKETSLINNLMGQESSLTSVGIEDTLKNVQQGRVRQLVIARGLRGKARQCEHCGRLSHSEATECLVCRGKTRSVELRAIVPELARKFGLHVEVVGGKAARKLIEEGGGIAAQLRYPASKAG